MFMMIIIILNVVTGALPHYSGDTVSDWIADESETTRHASQHGRRQKHAVQAFWHTASRQRSGATSFSVRERVYTNTWPRATGSEHMYMYMYMNIRIGGCSWSCSCSCIIYIYIYIYIYICIHIHTYIHTYIHACMHACIHTYITCIITCKYMYIYIYIYIYVCMYVCVYTYIYIYIYIYILSTATVPTRYSGSNFRSS